MVQDMDKLIGFFRGGADNYGRTLDGILAWDDAHLEEVHDYIQWLFPLPEPSSFHPEAPALDPETIAAFRADSALQARLHAAFVRMLSFYGLQLGRQGVVRAEGFREKSYGWLQPGNHNHLRLTRILRSLRLLGLEWEADSLFECLSAIYKEEAVSARPRISARTFRFWKEAAGG
jgi:hypothetical protein